MQTYRPPAFARQQQPGISTGGRTPAFAGGRMDAASPGLQVARQAWQGNQGPQTGGLDPRPRAFGGTPGGQGMIDQQRMLRERAQYQSQRLGANGNIGNAGISRPAVMPQQPQMTRMQQWQQALQRPRVFPGQLQGTIQMQQPNTRQYATTAVQPYDSTYRNQQQYLRDNYNMHPKTPTPVLRKMYGG